MYGGLGLSNSAYSRVIQQVSRYDASTSLTLGAHSSIGMKGLLLFGTEEQKKKYLPSLSSGKSIASFCLTESGAGSDAASIKTRAVEQADGSWLLNGEKIWITNGPMAEFFTVFAQTGDSDKNSMSAFIVERVFSGVSTGPKEDKMGIRASATSTVHFDNVLVPKENLLGEVGEGFKIAMAILNNGRTGLGGGCVGGIKRCIALSIEQAKNRKQFGKPIAEYSLIKKKIVDMAVDCFICESLVSYVGAMIDSGSENFSVEAAISKVFASEALWRAANESLQIAGGNGFMKEYPYEGIVRDCRINMIFEGTNEILRLYIALSGLKETRNYLKDVESSLENILSSPIESFGELSGYVSKKISALTTLGLDRVEAANAVLRDEVEIVERYTPVFSQTCESVLRRYKKDIVNQQLVLGRVADTAIDLFSSLVSISRASALLSSERDPASSAEKKILQLFTHAAKRRINQNLRRVEKRNEDNISKELADFLIYEEGYKWDIL